MPRKQKKYHFIYKTTCIITGKFYVGMHSTDNLNDGYLGSGKILGYSRRKYGDQNHKLEILEMCGSRELRKQREKEIVNEALLADPLNINLKYGGEGGWDHLNDGGESHLLRCRKAARTMNSKKDKSASSKKAYITRKQRNKHATFATTGACCSTVQSKRNLGKKWITNGILHKRVNCSDIEFFLSAGWKFGRIVK